MYFSIHWRRLQYHENINKIEITFLDQEGNCERIIKYYEDWIGVCTNNIDKLVCAIKESFPCHKVLYRKIGSAKKILPYFEDRLAKNKLDYRLKPFYKVYTKAFHKDVGELLHKYKVSYLGPDDWLIRIYIDLCSQYDTYSFYYKWYELENDSQSLTDSLRMVSDHRDEPDWTVAAFDIETVSLIGNVVPKGYRKSDRIVMLSLYKWNRRLGVRKWLLYLLPKGARPVPDYEHAFETESEMLIRFHALLDDAQIVTGYNINEFDFPCIFARLCWLDLSNVLRYYTSSKVGSDLVVTYKNKIVLDLYAYFKTFSDYDLPSYKLDDVARVKLNETKLQVKSTGISSWYRNPDLARNLLDERDVKKCFDSLKPDTVSGLSEFGTFRTYLDYCLRDSELVYRLFVEEHVLSFLVERANFTALDAVKVLHLGNSRYLLELFKTYGTRLGYFINPKFFGTSFDHDSKYERFYQGKTYQGALNFCVPEQIKTDVSVMDFSSMYPNALRNCNLCYGTCTIMTREEWSSNDAVKRMVCIPYRQHSDGDFTKSTKNMSKFSYPKFDPASDEVVIVVNPHAEAFLPKIVDHFIEMRKHHQKEFKRTEEIYHYNVQLGIKILINSLYGVMATKDSPLAYLPVAMTIVTLSRYQLLGSYHYLKNLGYDVCYADTDSLMVHRWPVENCDRVNEFLNLPYVELKFEQRMKHLVILSKKRYVYERFDNPKRITKGFQKKINGLVEFMTDRILHEVWKTNFYPETVETEKEKFSKGWNVWVETVLEADYLCRDPKRYSIYRRVKTLSEYKSTSCPSVKFLKKYPDKNQEHVEFTYSRADVSAKEASNWVVAVEDCQCVDFEKLFVNQKRIFCLLLNMTYWHMKDPVKLAYCVLNNLRWKRFVHAELLHYHATGRRIAMLVEPSVKYTFAINDHFAKKRKVGRSKKLCTIGNLPAVDDTERITESFEEFSLDVWDSEDDWDSEDED